MSVNSKMTVIADKIRELSGTAEIMGLDAMATYIGEANDDVHTEANLIAQIAEALNGKASGGASGGNAQTATITLSIDAPVGGGKVYYVSLSGLEVIDLMGLSPGDTMFMNNCIVPSIISSSAGFMSFSGEISKLDELNGLRSYYVTGPGTLYY